MNANDRVAGRNTSSGSQQNQQVRQGATGKELPEVDLEVHEIITASRPSRRVLPRVDINAVPIAQSGSNLQSKTLPIPELSQHRFPPTLGPSSSTMPVAPELFPHELPSGTDSPTKQDLPQVDLFRSALPEVQQKRPLQEVVRPHLEGFQLPDAELPLSIKVVPDTSLRPMQMPSFPPFTPQNVLEVTSDFITPNPFPSADPIHPSVGHPRFSLTRTSHRVLKEFGDLAQEKSFEQIYKKAFEKGTLGDVRMLQRHSLLKSRYIQEVFYHLVEDLPMLLPQSVDFYAMVDVDLKQLDLFITFCNKLKEVHNVEQLRELQFRQNTYLDHLIGVQLFKIKHAKVNQGREDTSKRLMQAALEEGLINIKNFFYCFLTEYVRQQQEIAEEHAQYIKDNESIPGISDEDKKWAEKYQAHQEKLNDLVHALSLLSEQIQKDIHAIRMRVILNAKNVDMENWEDRTPRESGTITKSATGAVDRTLLNSTSVQIENERPEASQLNDYINQVLHLSESTDSERREKAKLFLKLARVYARLPEAPAWEEAILWANYALATLASPASTIPENDPERLDCLGFRGKTWFKLAKFLYKDDLAAKDLALQNPQDDIRLQSPPLYAPRTKSNLIPKYYPGVPSSRVVVIRKNLDSSYRDFDASSQVQESYVRDVHRVKDDNPSESKLQILQQSLESDNDYAEAYYQEFLTLYEKLKLDERGIIHKDFGDIREVPNPQAFETFCNKLLEPKNIPRKTTLKVKCDGEYAYLKIEENRILIDRPGIDFVTKMLTKGVSHVTVVPKSEGKVYLVEAITKKGFNKCVQSLRRDYSRLKDIETAIQIFREFEVSALYKSTIKNGLPPESKTPNVKTPDSKEVEKEEVPGLGYDSIRQRIPELRTRLIDLHVMAVKGNKELNSLPTALLHICHAIAECSKILDGKKDREIEQRKLTLMIEKAMLYKEMDLDLCHLQALEDAIEFGKKTDSKYVDPSIVYLLAAAYIAQKRWEDAKEQLDLLKSNSYYDDAIERIEDALKKERPNLSQDIGKEGQERQTNLLGLIRKLYDPKQLPSVFSNDKEWLAFKEELTKANTTGALTSTLFTPIRSPLTDEDLKEIDKCSKPFHDDSSILENLKQECLKLLVGNRETAILIDFHDKNIEEECLQMLHEHYRANENPGDTRLAPLWANFISQLNKISSVRQFCELILSIVLPSKTVTVENFQRIARLSNLDLSDPRSFDEIKNYALDAVTKYQQIDALLEDQLIKKVDEARKRVKQIVEYNKFKDRVRKKLRDGEVIRPGSKSRKKIENFKSYLSGVEINAAQICTHLAEISGETLSDKIKDAISDPNNIQDLKSELLELVKNALEITMDSGPSFNDNVWLYTGFNVFLSEIIKDVESRSKNSDVYDIHIIGVNVYVDTDITMHSTNLAIGGEYVQFLKKADGSKITIDLSGVAGKDGDEVKTNATDGPNAENIMEYRRGHYKRSSSRRKVVVGVKAAEPGGKGDNGIHGKGGHPGGDLCVRNKDPIEGLTNENVLKINISGGKGGNGSSGRPGGKGGDGKEGQSYDRKPTSEFLEPGYNHWKDGDKGAPAAEGGKGGNAGVGAFGGEKGILDIVPRPTDIEINEEDGKPGEKGDAGAGGKAGKPEPNGLGYAIGKPGPMGSGWNKRFYLPRLKPGGDEYQADGWHDATTREQTIESNSAIQRGAGLDASDQKDQQHSVKKHGVKSELLSTNLQKHLHTRSAGSKAYAFEAVTNRSAVLHFAEKILNQELAQQQKKRKDLENLCQTTKQLLQQTQSQKTVQTERIANATVKKAKEVDRQNLIRTYIRGGNRDKLNLLPFQKYSPVIRLDENLKGQFSLEKIELAIDAINTTEGRDLGAIARLIQEIKPFMSLLEQNNNNNSSESSWYSPFTNFLFGGPKKTELTPQESNKQQAITNLKRLWEKLPQFIEAIPFSDAVRDFDKISNVMADLGRPESIPLTRTVSEIGKNVSKVRELIEKETPIIKGVYQRKIDDLKIKSALIKFMHRDRLCYAYITRDTNEPPEDNNDQTKKRLDDRLNEAIANFSNYLFVDDHGKYFKYAQDLVKEIADQKKVKKDYHDFLKQRRIKVKKSLSKLQSHERWILDHLPELLHGNCIPSVVLKRKMNFIGFYNACVSFWQSMPSDSKRVERDANIVPTIPNPLKDPYEKWIKRFKNKDPNPEKLAQIESYIRELQKSINNDQLEPYLEVLLENYPEKAGLEGILGVFVALARILGRDIGGLRNSLKDLMSENPDSLFVLRNGYLDILNKKENENDLVKQQMCQVILSFLTRRSVNLRKVECEKLLNDAKPKDIDKVDHLIPLVVELLIRSLQLHQTDIFLNKNVDFLKIATTVVAENSKKIWDGYQNVQSIKEANHPVEEDVSDAEDGDEGVDPLPAKVEETAGGASQPPERVKVVSLRSLKLEMLFDEVIKRAASLSSTTTFDNHDAVVGQFEKVLKGNITRDLLKETIRPLLFILSNLQLDYKNATRILKILIEERLEKTIKDNPILQTAILFFKERVEAKQAEFEGKWQGVINTAKALDQIRFQLDPNDDETIENTLYQIGAEATFLAPHEKIEIMQQMVDLFSNSLGCYSALGHLRVLQNSLIKKYGENRAQAVGGAPKNYYQELQKGFGEIERKEERTQEEIKAKRIKQMKSLGELFMQMISTTFTKDFLSDCLIALHHYPLDTDQLLLLYEKIESIPKEDLKENQKATKRKCLEMIPQLLLAHLTKEHQRSAATRKSHINELQAKQLEVVDYIRETLKSAQVLFPERYAAKVYLWMQLLNAHFEAAPDRDRDGTKRHALYDKALKEFKKTLSGDLKTALETYSTWLRRECNETIQPGSVVTKDSLVTAVKNLAVESEAKKSREYLNRFYFRDLIPYSHDDDTVETVITSIAKVNFPPKGDEEKLIKRKLDDAMVYEDATTVKQETEKHTIENEKALGNWIEQTRKALNEPDITVERLKTIFPPKSQLNDVFGKYKIPTPSSTVKENTVSMQKDLQETIQELLEKRKDKEFNKFMDNALPRIREYLDELSNILEVLPTGGDFSWDVMALKTLNELLAELPKKKSITSNGLLEAEIKRFQVKLMDREDKLSLEKKKKIKIFVDCLKQTYRYTKDNSNRLYNVDDHEELTKQFGLLEKMMRGASVLLPEEAFHGFLDVMISFAGNDKYKESLSLQMLQQLFWVVPRLDNPAEFLKVCQSKKPDSWAKELLERHVLREYERALLRKMNELPVIDLDNSAESVKEQKIDAALKEVGKACKESYQSFKEGLHTLSVTGKMKTREKEMLLHLLADRLGQLNQGKLSYSIHEFSNLIKGSLGDEVVIERLSRELPNTLSAVTRALSQPSFETMKYGLTLAWMQSTLGLDIENADHRILIDGLFTIETTKKDGGMRQVVESLRGTQEATKNNTPLISRAVVEAVSHFANNSWDIDVKVLQLLMTRSPDNNWYADIETHVKSKLGRELTLKELVSVMANGKKGINKSIAHLLGDDLKLMTDVEDIQKEYEKVSKWTKEDVKKWATDEKNRREAFGTDPEELKRGIAIVSRGCELIYGHKLRDTQLIATWIKLRPGTNSMGRISQMSTGEGKSYVFAALAILRAMTTCPVDVVTTSYILAERDAAGKNKELIELFGMTVSNNCDRECEADEEKRKDRYYNATTNKPVDIIYGDVGAFERDILLTQFHDKKIIHTDRLNRKGSVLVDEVDGLFLDNASMVLYLSHNVDTLRFLQRVFETIWTVANQSNLANAHPYDDRSVAYVTNMVKQRLSSDVFALPEYRIPEANYMEMQSIIDRKITTWVRSALHAKTLNPNEEYIIIDQLHGDVKRKSVIVMDKGTGVEQFSLRWSNGLHQFLQLKHGLELAPDSLKAVFLSNYFFFKRYGKNIYGLSGTLGSDTEQKYLEQLYNVELCKIPRYKGERPIGDKATVVAEQSEWIEKIRETVKTLVDKQRAVLIICNTVQDVMDIEKELKPLYPSLKIYTSSLQTKDIDYFAEKDPRLVGCGDIIIATNLAGRGTDFKTNSQLEAKGGLHVILTYLPDNIRIQEQGFGRTARSGNDGSGEFIIKDKARRPITQLGQIRDQNEKQRLEIVAAREVEKIKFEHELLTGFFFDNDGKKEKIEGFESLLSEIKQDLQGQEKSYKEAQLSSLKNRWAFWIDHMEEKIGLVHVIGRDSVVASFKQFISGVKKDYYQGDPFFRLVKEPIELIKLGGEYRRAQQWSNAMKCYKKAAEDKHYGYVAYYQAACDFIQEPTSSYDAKLRFKKEAKGAIKAIQPEIKQLQNSVQSITPLVEQLRVQTGAPDYGNPYKAREEDKVQVWSIFLSAIDDAIGNSCSAESLKKSQFGTDKVPDEILQKFHETQHYKKQRLSKRLQAVEKDKRIELAFRGKTDPKVLTPIALPQMFAPVLKKLQKGPQESRNIEKKDLKEYCKDLRTQKSVLEDLQKNIPCTQNTIRIRSLPPSYDKWPDGTQDNVKGLMPFVVEKLSGEAFKTDDEVVQALKKHTEKYPPFKGYDLKAFVEKLKTTSSYSKDVVINLGAKFRKCKEKFDTVNEAVSAFKSDFAILPEELQIPIIKASLGGERATEGSDKMKWGFQNEIYLSELPFPADTDAAAETLWVLLEEQEAIKPPKFKVWEHAFTKQKEKMKEELEAYFSGLGRKDKDLENAATDILSIIESSVGMIYKLEDKKTTAKFADIKQKYFLDQGKHFPPGVMFFIELGLEVIADLMEKKDPPAWYEVSAIILMGIVQMVAGAIIKAYLPFAGELIGNALMSTGMDDIMFAISSAISGEFSWDDYAAAKVESMKRSIISSAISCGVNFGVNSINTNVGQAWGQMGNVAANSTPGAFNITHHVLTEVGRSFLATGISQVTTRGLEGMTQLISGSYKHDIDRKVKEAIDRQWGQIQEQAVALHKKIGEDSNAQSKVEGCIRSSLKKMAESTFFDGAIRASKQAVGQASNLVALQGWSDYLAYAPDIINLGVSIPKLVNLVEDSVNQLAREIRDTKDREAEVAADEVAKAGKKQITPKDFEKFLDQAKKDFSRDVANAFNGVLNSAVFAPLVSMATREMQKAAQKALLPESKQEQFRHSYAHVMKLQEFRQDPTSAFSDDDVFRDWAGANTEVDFDKMSPDEKDKKPVNGDSSLRDLKDKFQNGLHIYKDKDGNIYVQRPNHGDYSDQVRNDHTKPGSAPELASIAKKLSEQKRREIDITIRNKHNGSVTTYTHDGKVVSGPTRDDAIILDVASESDLPGVGHVVLGGEKAGAKTESSDLNDCLYAAIGASEGMSIAELRNLAATGLENDPDLKLFYHNWSQSDNPKEFFGLGRAMYWAGRGATVALTEGSAAYAPAMGVLFAVDRERFNLGLDAVFALGEIGTGLTTTVGSGGLAAAGGILLTLDGYDRLQAAWTSYLTGRHVDSYGTMLLSQIVPHKYASGVHDGLGLGGMAMGAYSISQRAESVAKFTEAELKQLRVEMGILDRLNYKTPHTLPLENPIEFWDKGTSRSAEINADIHLVKHGKDPARYGGKDRNFLEYTEEALQFRNDNLTHKVDYTDLNTGQQRYKIEANGAVGVYTQDGKIVTYYVESSRRKDRFLNFQTWNKSDIDAWKEYIK